MSYLTENLHQVREMIREAAIRAGRNPADVSLIAVSKTVPVDVLRETVEAGILTFGENRVQELTEKYPQLPPEINWHLIGHLQTNKVKYIVDKVALIHSLDRFPLAEEINRRGEQKGQIINTLVQVNVAGEDTKFGLPPGEVKGFVEEVSCLPFVRICGLMTIAPYVTNPEEVRPVFRELRIQANKFSEDKVRGFAGNLLSMGMSGDFTVAIEEGANLVRIGSKIFGARHY